MYLSATNESLRVTSDVAATLSEPQFVISYQDITSAGMTLPMLSNQGATSGSSEITMAAAPAASTTRQVTEFHVSNIDTNNHVITVLKDVGGTNYIVIKLTLIPGQTLYYSRDAGFQVTTGNPNSNIAYQIESFTANGTYNKKENASFVLVSCVGAGGGGGSGRRGAAGTNRYGAGGGGGGAVVWRLLQNSVLSNTTTVTIGTGGAGGAGQTVDDTNGLIGTVGGNTSFGSFITAVGGGGGGAGASTAPGGGAGGSLATSIPSYGPYALSGAPSNTGQTSGGSPALTQGFINSGAPPGCAGGGISNTNVSSVANYRGGGVYNNGALIVGPDTNNSGANNQAPSLFFSDIVFGLEGLGTGGSGGRPGLENAGNGGLYGAGGGGGSGVLNGTTSGAGGNGGGGLCVVLTIY